VASEAHSSFSGDRPKTIISFMPVRQRAAHLKKIVALAAATRAPENFSDDCSEANRENDYLQNDVLTELIDSNVAGREISEILGFRGFVSRSTVLFFLHVSDYLDSRCASTGTPVISTLSWLLQDLANFAANNVIPLGYLRSFYDNFEEYLGADIRCSRLEVFRTTLQHISGISSRIPIEFYFCYDYLLSKSQLIQEPLVLGPH
jgi:hypothetical protein